MTKSGKAAKARQPRNEPQVNMESSRAGRERQPSDKIVAQRKFLCSLFSSNLMSKSEKLEAKAQQPHNKPQVNTESSRPGRECWPSDKIAAQRKFFCSLFFILKFKGFFIVMEQQEADLLRAQKEERRALREKKALQKANQQADLPSDGEGEYVPRATPNVSFPSHFFFIIISNGIIVCLP